MDYKFAYRHFSIEITNKWAIILRVGTFFAILTMVVAKQWDVLEEPNNYNDNPVNFLVRIRRYLSNVEAKHDSTIRLRQGRLTFVLHFRSS